MLIYVIRCGDALKVGITGDMPRRLRGLQGSNPLPLELVTSYEVPDESVLRIEQAAHALLSEHRGFGEWFHAPLERVTSAIRAAIAGHAEELAPAPLHKPSGVARPSQSRIGALRHAVASGGEFSWSPACGAAGVAVEYCIAAGWLESRASDSRVIFAITDAGKAVLASAP